MENSLTVVFLQQLLANQNVLFLKARNAHWNITGPDFKSVHVFFEDLYQKFHDDIDVIAERIRKLGYPVCATLPHFNANSTLESVEPTSNDSQTLIKYLLNDLILINQSIRNQIDDMSSLEDSKDFGTINFLTNLLEENEKTIWFLNSHLI